MNRVEFYRGRTEELLQRAWRVFDLNERSGLLAEAVICHMKAVQADAAPELLSAANDSPSRPGCLISNAPQPKV